MGAEREELAGFREMVDSLGAQLDLLYAERDDAAQELTALLSTVASLTEQLDEFYGLQERLEGRSLADLAASSVSRPAGDPGAER